MKNEHTRRRGLRQTTTHPYTRKVERRPLTQPPIMLSRRPSTIRHDTISRILSTRLNVSCIGNPSTVIASSLVAPSRTPASQRAAATCRSSASVVKSSSKEKEPSPANTMRALVRAARAYAPQLDTLATMREWQDTAQAICAPLGMCWAVLWATLPRPSSLPPSPMAVVRGRIPSCGPVSDQWNRMSRGATSDVISSPLMV
mmetsp:Transcript_23574/g.58261  ORF Transcript_23574/g.58261 Transcript_23574/m.58261 type:complete len:201 (+) Transcript_23574:461-1063(+)